MSGPEAISFAESVMYPSEVRSGFFKVPTQIVLDGEKMFEQMKRIVFEAIKDPTSDMIYAIQSFFVAVRDRDVAASIVNAQILAASVGSTATADQQHLFATFRTDQGNNFTELAFLQTNLLLIKFFGVLPQDPALPSPLKSAGTPSLMKAQPIEIERMAASRESAAKKAAKATSSDSLIRE